MDYSSPIFNENSLTLYDFVSSLTPLPTALIPEQWAQPIQMMSENLPLFTQFGFETHLGGDQVDFAVRIGSAELTEPTINAFRRLAKRLNEPVWDRIITLLQLPIVQDAWLEFDIEAQQSELHVPALFVSQKDKQMVGQNKTIPRPIYNLLPLMHGTSIQQETWDMLETIYASLPTNAQVYQIGIMLSREQVGLRMEIRCLSSEEMMTLLQKCGWVGDKVALKKTVDYWGALTDIVYLTFDILGDKIGPKIGLELIFNGILPIAREPRWTALTQSLVTNKLCSLEERDAILNWAGIVSETNSDENWNANLNAAQSLFGNSAEMVIKKFLNHIKIVFQHSDVTQAKVYFGGQLGWVINGKLY